MGLGILITLLALFLIGFGIYVAVGNISEFMCNTFHICSDVELGGECHNDNDCDDGLTCSNDKCIKEYSVAEFGKCTGSNDCAGKSCNYVITNYNTSLPSNSTVEKQCCASHKYDATFAKQMCHDLDDGRYCDANDWCSGGACIDHKCTKKGTVPLWSTCTDDDACQSGTCGYINSKSDQKQVCCSSIKYDSTRAHNMCHGLPVGYYCEADDWCADNDKSDVSRVMCSNNKCTKLWRSKDTEVQLMADARGEKDPLHSYKEGSYSAKPNSGWSDIHSYDDEYRYVCVPKGLKFYGWSGENGSDYQYGNSEITGPYCGVLGGNDCPKDKCKWEGGIGNLGTAAKLSSWKVVKA